MRKTCGIYLINKNDKLLITHPTNHPDFGSWSIPKGEPDSEEEAFLDTAVRELLEETGIDLSGMILNPNIKILPLPNVVYKSGKKTLYSFIVINKELDDINVVCNSFVNRRNGESFPENDRHKWVHISHLYMLRQYLHEAQHVNLEEVYNMFEKVKNFNK